MTSSDGVGWNLELVPAPAANATLLGLGGNTNLLLAAGSGGMLLHSPALLTNIVVPGPSGSVTQTVSSLGILWRAMPQPVTTNDLQAVAVLSNSVFVVAGARGSLFTSTNGTNWTSRNSKSTNFISGMCEWPGGLIASGKNGTILRSPDAFNWEAVPTGLTNWLYRVRWLNGRLVAVGQGGIVLSSTNGTDWSVKKSGTTAWLSDAAFIEDTWWVVGHGGTVLSSADLETWTDMGTLTLKSLYGAATDSKQLVTVGVEGIILRSQVVPDLAPVTILNYDRISTNGAAPAYNVFLFGGKVDQRFSLDSRTNLVGSAWTPGPELEFTDSSGTLYYVETMTDTNLPPIEFYQTRLLP
jgi:photosystem II stability/assembly factor-like uncharacterized protein